jgi:hypothetical protein
MSVNRNNILQHLGEVQLAIIGKTFDDVLDDVEWRKTLSMSKEQLLEFELYAIPLLKKVFKCNKIKALKTFAWFRSHYGLNIS